MSIYGDELFMINLETSFIGEISQFNMMLENTDILNEAVDIKAIIKNICNGIKTIWEKFVSAIKTIIDKIKNFFKKNKESDKKVEELKKECSKIDGFDEAFEKHMRELKYDFNDYVELFENTQLDIDKMEEMFSNIDYEFSDFLEDGFYRYKPGKNIVDIRELYEKKSNDLVNMYSKLACSKDKLKYGELPKDYLKNVNRKTVSGEDASKYFFEEDHDLEPQLTQEETDSANKLLKDIQNQTIDSDIPIKDQHVVIEVGKELTQYVSKIVSALFTFRNIQLKIISEYNVEKNKFIRYHMNEADLIRREINKKK